MKKFVAVSLLAATLPFSGVAMADADVGCGLGTMIFDGKKGKVFKVLAATTNGTSGNQTFGISLGTLGCDGNGTIHSREKIALFIDGNMDNLARDIAKGEGETLDTLAQVWGIQDADKVLFTSMTQDNFGTIYAAANVTSNDVMVNINNMLVDSDTLSAYAL
ncbi:DUF3015 family protein [Ferrimonas senticii]|uniref:DUF3015 family protein n=1 Tax=Ferrimonas senticii TaxID=394566 RepID=UPI00040D9D2C|nr:DUF3015 family protein [Ferrimonas senticii]